MCRSASAGTLVDPAALRFDDPVLDLVAHAEPVTATDRVRLHHELDRRVEVPPVDGDRPALLEPDRHVLGRDLDVGVPVGDTHDRRDDLHARAELFERLRLVRGAPDVGVGRVRLLDRVAVRQVAGGEELAHALAAAELVDERRVEPRLVDPQVRVDQQPVAVEALDVVALVGRAVAPHVDAVVGHRPHQQRAGDGPPERRRVEVRLAGGGDVERAALQRDQALADQLVAAVDEAGLLGAVHLGPVGHGVEFGLVVLAEVGGVGVRDRSAVAHPGDGGRRVEPAGEGDADAFADRQRHEDLRVRGGGGCSVGHGRRRYPAVSDRGWRYMPVNAAADTTAAAPAIANSTIARPVERERSGTAIADQHRCTEQSDRRHPWHVVARQDPEHGGDDERHETDQERLRIRSGSEPPRGDPEFLARLPHRHVGDEHPDPGGDHHRSPWRGQLARSRSAGRRRRSARTTPVRPTGLERRAGRAAAAVRRGESSCPARRRTLRRAGRRCDADASADAWTCCAPSGSASSPVIAAALNDVRSVASYPRCDVLRRHHAR